MADHELTKKVQDVALGHGADLVGIVKLADLPEHEERIFKVPTVSRFLEPRRFPSIAMPAFIPIDMQDPGKGMKGEICWRRAGVRAGLGSYGENGLLVTGKFGSAIRLAGVLTTADLELGHPSAEDVCEHCGTCLSACPVAALSASGGPFL